ncbi:MAG: hypothetical protein AAGK14_09710 [Verrucomicrobiota bacterium]
MQFPPRWSSFLTVTVLLALAATSAQAQSRAQREITLTEIERVYAAAPQVIAPGIPGRKIPREDTDWMVINFSYEVAPLNQAAFLDEAEFRVYVEVLTKRDPRAKDFDGEGAVLTGSVTYVNIPEGENNGVVYIPPQTVARYGGRKELERVNPECNIFIEAFANRRQVDGRSMNAERGNQANWYQAMQQIDGLIFRQNQSPFIATDTIGYPPIKVDNR